MKMGADVTVMERAGVVTDPASLLALTVKWDVPSTVGVPDRAPVAELRWTPIGRAPEATENVGAGSPSAAKV
jgi:hypothetical protein